MGNVESLFQLDGGMNQTLPGGLFIVANASDIDLLRGSAAAQAFGNASFVPLSPDEALPREAIEAAKVLVLEVDPASKNSLRRLAEVRAERKDLPIIAALHEANVSVVRTVVRQGVTDVAVLPFAPEELASQILDASAKLAEQASEASLAPMITVVRSTGGVGTTTVITHLAAALAQTGEIERGVCVIDLDLQSGDVASFVGQSPKVTVEALLESGDRLDAELLRSAVTDSKHGFSVIAAPEAIVPLETVDVDHLLKLLTLLRREFGYVLVDLPADWTNWALSVAMASTDVLLITDLTISSLRQAKRRLELLGSLGLGKDRIRVLVNRVERRLFKTIGVDEVREALHCDVLATLAAEGTAMSSAQDQGLLITDVTHRSKFGGDIRSLAQLLILEGR